MRALRRVTKGAGLTVAESSLSATSVAARMPADLPTPYLDLEQCVAECGAVLVILCNERICVLLHCGSTISLLLTDQRPHCQQQRGLAAMLFT